MFNERGTHVCNSQMKTAYELRTHKLPGTHYVQHTILVAGVVAASQIGPYSENEIEQRVRAHLNPMAVQFRAPEFVPGSKGTAKAYGARGGKAGRRPKAEAGAPPWSQLPEEE